MKSTQEQPGAPRLTIITVCRNAAATLQRTLDSVLAQRYEQLEYIVIDGASTDDTPRILRNYASSISKLVSEPDAGIYDAMNKGLRLASGDLIGFIMADDQYLPGAFAAVAEAWATAPRADLYVGAVRVFNPKTNASSVSGPVFRSSSTRPLAAVPHPSAFVTREAYQRFGVYDLSFRISADAELFYRFAKQGASLVEIPSTLAQFNSGGVSSRNAFAPILENYRVRRRYSHAAVAAADLVRNTIRHWVLPRIPRPQWVRSALQGRGG